MQKRSLWTTLLLTRSKQQERKKWEMGLFYLNAEEEEEEEFTQPQLVIKYRRQEIRPCNSFDGITKNDL